MSKTNDVTLTFHRKEGEPQILHIPYDQWVDPDQKQRIIGMIDAMMYLSKRETT